MKRILFFSSLLVFLAACGAPGESPVAPAPPEGLAADYNAETGHVDLTWEPSAGATGYNVFRSTEEDFEPNDDTLVNAALFTDPSYMDETDLEPGTYYYAVTAVNLVGQSEMSDVVDVTVPEDDMDAEPTAHTFSYTPPADAPDFTSLEVRGQFNDWGGGEAIVMEEQDDGSYSAEVELEDGRYEYKFVFNGDNWVNNMCDDPTWGDPDNNFWVDVNADGCSEDGFGGANAYIDIGETTDDTTGETAGE